MPCHFPKWLCHFAFPPVTYERSCCFTFSPIFDIDSIFNFSHSSRYVVVSHSDADHLSCAYWWPMYCILWSLFWSFCPSHIGLSLYYWVVRDFIYRKNKPIIKYFLKIFFQVITCLFMFLTMNFEEQNSNFDEVHFVNYSFIVYVFHILLKEFLPNPMSQIFFYSFF